MCKKKKGGGVFRKTFKKINNHRHKNSFKEADLGLFAETLQ